MLPLHHHRTFSRTSPGGRLRTALLSTTLLDEITTGVLVIGMPLLRDRLHLTYGEVGFLFTVGVLTSLLLDPLINLLADRGAKRRPVLLGMLGLILGFSWAGTAPSFFWLLAAFALLSPASGAAVGLAQAALIDLHPTATAGTMARWALFGSVGDLLAPATIAALVGAGWGWSALCAAAAACWLLLLVVINPQRFTRPVRPSAEAVGGEVRLGDSLRAALGDRTLLRWAGVELCCTMLDEVFVGFAALYVRDRLGAAPAEVALMLLPGAIAALLALASLGGVLRRVPGPRLLPWLAAVALIGMTALLTAPALWVAALALVAINAGAAGWYPIARAAAFDRYPGRPGLVRAILGVTTPVELALPGVVGLVAGHFGITAGVAMLGLAPVGVLLLFPRQHAAKDPLPAR